MTLSEFIAVLIIAVFGLLSMMFYLGYHCGREDLADSRRWERGRHPYPDVPAPEGDIDDYFDTVIRALLDDDRPARLASTGELAALYGGEYPGWQPEGGSGPQEMIA
jgi:hypothetical protein